VDGAQRAEEGWHAAHRNNYGIERWETLHIALHRDVEHLCFLNPFLPAEAQARIQSLYKLVPTTVLGAFTFELPAEPQGLLRTADNCDEHNVLVEVPPHEQDPESSRLSPFFFSGGANVILAHALNVCESDSVLEMYASPGGKSVVLAAAMFAKAVGQEHVWPAVRGKLVCNEVSKPKSTRLQKTLRDYLPPALFDTGHQYGAHVVFTSAEPGTSSNSMERNGPYDKILLSAPCVCDRTLLRGDGVEMSKWSAGKVKVSADRQLKLMYNALWQLREGGLLVYSSTSLSPAECDGVVESLLMKSRRVFVLELLPLEEDLCRMVPAVAAEHTDWGTRILPDKTPFGPIYFSRIRLIKRIHESVRQVPHI
jgi:hypothetical protein